MKQTQRFALLTLLNREMLRRGSWCGETHIQKATYFLQELLGVDLGFEFILYKHGPFSFELRDELLSMQADQLLELAVRQPGYGPTYVPTSFGVTFQERFPSTTSRYSEQVQFVADEMGNRGVVELEKLATAFFIVDREGIKHFERRAQRLVDLKPHVSMAEARWATEIVDELIAKSRQVSLREIEEDSA
ncbi:MAG: hypothetical protein LAO03_11520 [Acidobacteriia bacterium]|nr:hypothetical protein [Terriglobia bacterium]